MAWKKTDFLVWNNPIYRIYNWIQGPFCRCGGPLKGYLWQDTFHKNGTFSKAKKQHQAGWGEGDDGEDRLGQFFRLKDRVGLGVCGGMEMFHMEKWRMEKRHGKHIGHGKDMQKYETHIETRHEENRWKHGKRLRSEQTCSFFFRFLHKLLSKVFWKMVSNPWILGDFTPHLAFFSISEDSFLEETHLPKNEISGSNNFHVWG